MSFSPRFVRQIPTGRPPWKPIGSFGRPTASVRPPKDSRHPAIRQNQSVPPSCPNQALPEPSRCAKWIGTCDVPSGYEKKYLSLQSESDSPWSVTLRKQLDIFVRQNAGNMFPANLSYRGNNNSRKRCFCRPANMFADLFSDSRRIPCHTTLAARPTRGTLLFVYLRSCAGRRRWKSACTECQCVRGTETNSRTASTTDSD